MTSTIDLSVILSDVSTSLIDSGVRGIVDTIERVVSTYADKCPPEVSELQELLAAIGLSCTFGSTEGNLMQVVEILVYCI